MPKPKTKSSPKSRACPGYAGTYFDTDGTPTTNLVDLDKAHDAEQATAFMTKGGKNGEGPRSRSSKRSPIDFLKLKEWKSKATRSLLSETDIAFVDIDEENNRLNVECIAQPAPPRLSASFMTTKFWRQRLQHASGYFRQLQPRHVRRRGNSKEHPKPVRRR